MIKKSKVQQNYPLAPIIEAVIDIKVLPPKDLDFQILDQKVRKDFLKEFPIVEKQIRKEFSFENVQNSHLNPTTSSIGLRFTSDIDPQILQIKLNGFTFSKLAPYENWEKFRDRAKHLWAIYQKALLPQQIERLGVRFINRFDFPGESIELSDYLKIFPQVPESKFVKGFSMQAIVGQPDIASTLIITQALIPSIKPNTTSILLDFDLFNEELRSINDDFWLFFEQLRNRKNKIFENSITDKTREVIS